MKPAIGAVYRHNINTRWAERLNLTYGNVTANDAQSSSAFQRDRNLDFRSPIVEFSGIFEFNFMEFSKDNPKYYYSPYIFAGIGIFYMNPQGTNPANGQWVDLQPLGTEGQGTASNPTPKYNLIQPCIPFGIGDKIALSKAVCLSIEWGMRKTFTGYLDDCDGVYPNPKDLSSPLAVAMSYKSLTSWSENDIGEQRGNGRDDWYSFAGVILTVVIHNQKNVCFSYD
jgi:hypothetical protein